MASSSNAKKKDDRIFLSYAQVLEHWHNKRVITIPWEHKWNKKGYTFQVFCRDDTHHLSEAKPICLHQNKWHSLGQNLTTGWPYVSLPAPKVHQFNTYADPIQPEELDPPTPLPQEPDLSNEDNHALTNKRKQRASDSISEEDDCNLTIIRHTGIREQPELTLAIIIQTDLTSPTITATQTITQISTTTGTQPAGNTRTIAEEWIAANIKWALNWNPGGNLSRNPGGAPALQQVVAPAGDARPIKVLPFVFIGNRTQAEAFLTAIRTYLNLNFNVPGFNSPIKKVALTLSLMQGPDTEL
jgi:hypothetical protein